MLTKSIAPPLRIQLEGTTLKLVPNPHHKSIFPTYRSIQRLGRPKQARDHLSQKLATDGASPELTPTQTEGL